jgi:prophage DNA circulation protein
MTDCRNWLATLWPASYMGVAFFFESDEETGGRSLRVHEFPNRDDPFVEDLGEAPRVYKGSAYIHGDDVDLKSLDLSETFASAGPGTLVLPLYGPIEVQCRSFTRRHERDKLGYVAYQIEFVRNGAAKPLISVLLAGQQIFDRADALASAVAHLFPAAVTLLNMPNYVVAAAIGEAETIAGTIEAVRLANPVDAATSATVHAASAAILTAAPLLISPETVAASDVANFLAGVPALDESFDDPVATLAAGIVATVRTLAAGMDGATAAAAMLALTEQFPAVSAVPALSPSAAAAAANLAAMTAIARLGALTAWAEALERQSFVSRSDGVNARAAAAERFELEMRRATGALNAALFVALSELRGAVVAYLTQLIADLAPVVTVSAPQSMPALWWAWRLYGDPERAVDLALRNQVKHPSFMPLSFEALAPGFAAPASLPTVWPAP